MKNNKPVYLIVIIAFFLQTGCSEVFEEDIESKELIIIAPSDGIQTSLNIQTFMWENLDGANYYNLRIVSPSFDSIRQLVLDTNIAAVDTVNGSTTKYTHTFIPGTYEWRLKAFNSSSEVTSTVRKFTIIETTDISNKQVKLIAPSAIINQAQNISFTWQSLYNANHYTFEIRTGEWSTGEIIVSKTVTENSFSVSHLQNGTYAWGVKAENDSATTNFSTKQLVIDTISPKKPVLLSPANDSIVNDTMITFKWSRQNHNGTALTDSLFIYESAGMNIPSEIFVTSDSSFTWKMETAGTYYWKVRTVDEAGNKSDFSESRSFIADF